MPAKMVNKNFGSKIVWVNTNFGPEKISPQKDFGPKILVKIGSVTVEIFLIWTNVA